MVDFTQKQIKALKRLANREIELSEVLQLSGTLKPFNFRLDTGLVDAMKKRAEAERITTSELMRKAAADYLTGT